MKELKIIGKNIVKLRKVRNLTQEDLCGMAQIDRSYLSEIENGKMNVTIKSLVTIAKALNCDLKDLIT
ncbi:MAG: helix-turn-helix transcriptional regulator [Alphaproteobacteria bacterium]|jgi:transcriptional regulator with XRE-family HTH domain|nr:helix-turn-helix transcriptional regulator [Alphaproteobacteria bacterium]